jgi:SanA protein
MRFWKIGARWVLYLFCAALALVIGCNVWVVSSTYHRVYNETEKLPKGKIALVLGTSHRLADGSPNPFFENRIRTAVVLYQTGKIGHLIVSGDNRTKYYNEPREMRDALMLQGVPQSAITLDYAGLRTLDSIVRSKEIFGQEEITIVTQPFHSYRALFISDYYGLKAIALVAEDPDRQSTMAVYWREYFARTKAVLDLYILKTPPHHMGEKEPINI